MTGSVHLACELVNNDSQNHYYYLHNFPFGSFSQNLASFYWRDDSCSDKSAILISQSPNCLKQVSFTLLSSLLRPRGDRSLGFFIGPMDQFFHSLDFTFHLGLFIIPYLCTSHPYIFCSSSVQTLRSHREATC